MKAYVGLDISARYFDACLLVDDKRYFKSFRSNVPGLKECVKWLEGFSVAMIAMEPTGRYGEHIAELLHHSGYKVKQVQPLMFSRYAESLDMRTKTDIKDSAALAVYAKERGNDLRDWEPKTETNWELRDTVVLLRSLTKQSTALKNQLSCGLRSQWVIEQIRVQLDECEKLKELALDRAVQLIKLDPLLNRDLELLVTIPGIGVKSACLMLTLIDFRRFSSSRQLACFMGLTKKKRESGDSIRGKDRLSKRGNGYIRAALFMPARVARIHNPLLASFAERLASKGKHDWAIQAAVIRKLITTAWALINHETEWNPDFVNSQFHSA